MNKNFTEKSKQPIKCKIISPVITAIKFKIRYHTFKSEDFFNDNLGKVMGGNKGILRYS